MIASFDDMHISYVLNNENGECNQKYILEKLKDKRVYGQANYTFKSKVYMVMKTGGIV